MKVGKALIVGEVWIYSIDQEEPVAHVTATYSVPPRKRTRAFLKMLINSYKSYALFK